MSEEQQDGSGKRPIYFGDATQGVLTMKQEQQDQEDARLMAEQRIADFGRDLEVVIKKHNHDFHFAATDPDILSEFVMSVIAVFKFATQSRDYRLFQRMSKASAEGKLDSLK